MVSTISAIIFSVLTGIVIVFQFALAFGVPWGEYSMGGQFKGKYPPKMRGVAFMNAIVLILMVCFVLARTDLLLPHWYVFSKSAIWFIVGFSVVAVVLNSITKSVLERKIWLPVSAGMLISSLIVALS